MLTAKKVVKYEARSIYRQQVRFVILVLAGVGAFYYFKVLKPKKSVKGSSDLDDFDFEDDEDEETEPDMFDDEQEDTGE